MIQAWYQLLQLLPFQWVQYDFMKNALLAVLLVTPVFALLGTMIVNNKMAFFSDALGHSALTGVGLGVVLGIARPNLAMMGFSLLFAVGIVWIKRRQKASMDTTIGVFSATAVALGVVFLSTGGINKYTSFLVGDILSIRPNELILLMVLLVVVIVVWRLIAKTLLLISLDTALATSRGVHTLGVELVFTALIALVVTLSIQWVGLLIINSLFVLPAAGARMVAKNMKQYTIICVCISMICGVGGLFASYFLGTATGATIALFCSGAYALSLVIVKFT